MTVLPASALFFFAVPFAAAVSLGYWVYADASARGSDRPLLWGVLTVLFVPVGLYYWYVRGDVGERRRRPDRGERVALVVALGTLGAYVLAATVAPPDPHTQGRYSLGFLVVTLPVAFGAVRVWRKRREREGAR